MRSLRNLTLAIQYHQEFLKLRLTCSVGSVALKGTFIIGNHISRREGFFEEVLELFFWIFDFVIGRWRLWTSALFNLLDRFIWEILVHCSDDC
jgi:hypothetical protein